MIPSFAGEDTMRFRMLKILRPMILRFIIRSLQINFFKKNDEVDVRGEKFVISESVFNPKLFYSSELMMMLWIMSVYLQMNWFLIWEREAGFWQ